MWVHKNSSSKSKRHRNKSGVVRKRNQPRTCEICNKTFRFHSNLERHKLTHTGEKPYLCNVCGKGFAQMAYLKIHSFIHTGLYTTIIFNRLNKTSYNKIIQYLVQLK